MSSKVVETYQEFESDTWYVAKYLCGYLGNDKDGQWYIWKVESNDPEKHGSWCTGYDDKDKAIDFCNKLNKKVREANMTKTISSCGNFQVVWYDAPPLADQMVITYNETSGAWLGIWYCEQKINGGSYMEPVRTALKGEWDILHDVKPSDYDGPIVIKRPAQKEDQKTMEEKERYRVEFDPNDNKWKLYDTRNIYGVESYMSKSIAENVCSYRNDRHREADITNDKNTRCIFSKGNVKIYKYGFFLIIVHIENGNITFHCPYASVGDPSVATRKKMEKAFAEKFFECANPPTNP